MVTESTPMIESAIRSPMGPIIRPCMPYIRMRVVPPKSVVRHTQGLLRMKRLPACRHLKCLPWPHRAVTLSTRTRDDTKWARGGDGCPDARAGTVRSGGGRAVDDIRGRRRHAARSASERSTAEPPASRPRRAAGETAFRADAGGGGARAGQRSMALGEALPRRRAPLSPEARAGHHTAPGDARAPPSSRRAIRRAQLRRGGVLERSERPTLHVAVVAAD